MAEIPSSGSSPATDQRTPSTNLPSDGGAATDGGWRVARIILWWGISVTCIIALVQGSGSLHPWSIVTLALLGVATATTAIFEHGWHKASSRPRTIYRAVLIELLLCMAFSALAYAVWSDIPKKPSKSSISLEAFVSLGHKKGASVAGFTWPDDRFYDVRVVVNNAGRAVQDIDLTVKTLDKSGDVFWGMGQISDIPEVQFTKPQALDSSIKIRGADGKDYTLSLQDAWHTLPDPFGDHWNMFCPRLATEQKLLLVIAAIHYPDQTAPQNLKITGSYKVVFDGKTVDIPIDQTIPVKH